MSVWGDNVRHMTAQDAYRSLLNDVISPGMRSRGFRGGSGKYYMDGATGHIGSLLFGRNPKRSSKQRISFGIHIGVRSRYLQEFRSAQGEAVNRRPSYAFEHDWLDVLVHEHVLNDGDDVELIGARLLDTIDHGGLPRIKESMTDAGLRKAVDHCPVGVGGGAARTLMEIENGNLDVAREAIAASVARVTALAQTEDVDDDVWRGYDYLSRRLQEGETRNAGRF